MTTMTPSDLRSRALNLGLHGLVARWGEVAQEAWLLPLIEAEERARQERSLQRRIKSARFGRFKPLANFDWHWPKRIDREAVQDLFTFDFLPEAANVVLVGPNGVGKTMLAQNLAHQAVLRGETVRFVSASDMLNDLATQGSEAGFARRLHRYVQPRLLVIEEVGYLSYDARHADLLFEVVTRRYEQRSIVITTNKPFADLEGSLPQRLLRSHFG